MSLTKRTILFAAASAAALTAGHAAAQNEGRTVDVITVTAQKREEGIQDVPVAVTAYSEELLSNAGVRDLKDLAVIAPGLNVTSTSNEFQTTARIRGIGTVGDNPGLESSVGVVING
ncbi:MAG: TonB-dependent receptor, partial [Maricaulis sp.]|nr:TonB-dependent receptor [Maricaulis sp.]